MFNLAVCYQNEHSIEKDQSKAIELYNQSFQLGNMYAMYDLAICYHIDHGVKINYQVAFGLFMKASNKRYACALCYYFFILLVD
jgi:TPR repeat protein